MDFEPNKVPPAEGTQILFQFANYDIHNLFLIQSMIYRGLIAYKNLQIAYFIHGPSGSGKTSLVKLVIACIENSKTAYVRLKECETTFTRFELMNKNCIIISEESEIKKTGEDFLKKVSGRYIITCSKKKIQGEYEFIHEGTGIMISNETPEDIFKNSFPVLDRFFCINLKSVPKESNPYLGTIFSKHTPSIFNWVLSIKQDSLNKLVRTRSYNTLVSLESSEVRHWMIDNIAFDTKGCIPVEIVFTHFKDYMLGKNKRERISTPTFVQTIQELANKVFDIKIAKDRKLVNKTKPNVLTPIRFKDEENISIENRVIQKRFNEDVWHSMVFPVGDSNPLPLD